MGSYYISFFPSSNPFRDLLWRWIQRLFPFFWRLPSTLIYRVLYPFSSSLISGPSFRSSYKDFALRCLFCSFSYFFIHENEIVTSLVTDLITWPPCLKYNMIPFAYSTLLHTWISFVEKVLWTDTFLSTVDISSSQNTNKF